MSLQSVKRIFDCPVISNSEVARGIFLMRLHAPEIAVTVKPGQFVNVQVQPASANALLPLLRRPFSVCQADPQNGTIALIWKIVGAGTRMLAGHLPGTVLNLIGPLGNGYAFPDKKSEIVLVAGGLGIAPMPMLAAALRERGFRFEALLGARTAAELWGAEILHDLGGATHLSTDDGSAGHHGFVTKLLETWLEKNHHAANPKIYACGPMPMLARVAAICRRVNVSAQIAIETMMGCGFGICMGCPVEPAQGVAQTGRYYLACLDGPVFEANEIRHESFVH